jgi:methyl-accepting chemotaxis protein
LVRIVAWFQQSGLKRKFLVSTIAAVVVVPALGGAILAALYRYDPAGFSGYLIGVSLFYIAAGISAIVLMTRIMVHPVVSLTRKVERVRRGDLSVDTEARALAGSGDEMDQLVAGFAQHGLSKWDFKQ